MAVDELYDGPFGMLSAVDNRCDKRILSDVLDHDPTHDDILLWICGVKPKSQAVNKPSYHSIMHELGKPGVFTTVSQYLVKVSGKSLIGSSLELGQDITLTLKGAMVKLDHLDNQDGTMDVCATVKATEVEVM